jgi:uroporphyrinogen-III decarboxylase
MTENQWKELGEIVKGKSSGPLQTGFIVDSPWLPKWFGVKILDYFTNDDIWLKANLHVINTFPDAMFLPGFWSELGMCSEPSAFGSRCSFPANEFPHAHRVIHSIDDISRLSKPDPEKDGLAPFILNRLLINQQKIEDAGHKIYFSVSRGPLNIASYLMGTTEFMTAMITHPEEIHSLLQLINNYLIDIHEIQMQAIPSIDGILILDDLIGFIGEEEFREFGLPYFKQLFNRDVSIKFLHNDASWISSIAYMNEIGINLFNMGFEPNLNELKELTDHQVTMLGNIPPRDVLANGSVLDIEKAVKELIQKLDRRDRVIVSCGGGMPPNVSTENINCFIEMVQKYGH